MRSFRSFRFPRPLQSRLEQITQAHLQPEGAAKFDFLRPKGEPALLSADSVSWQVFKNPIALVIGGIAAVLLELAEPRVRSGVWEFTTFRTDPLTRMQRTGLAAMITVYGPETRARQMIASVCRMHSRIQGTTPAGIPYRADDPDLLRWVHATASYGFLEAFRRFVRPVPKSDRDRYYSEGPSIAKLYGTQNSPASENEWHDLFDRTLPMLESSEIIFEFLRIMKTVPLMPRPFRSFNHLLIRAAIDILPPPARLILDLEGRYRLPPGSVSLLKQIGSFADRILLDTSPAVQASARLGLPKDYLFRKF